MKIAVFSDIHGNYEALKSIIEATKNYDRVIFAGDAIGMGPNPKECIQLLLENNIEYIMGNHEQYLIEGYENFDNVEEYEWEHHKWVRGECQNYINIIMGLPKEIKLENILITHYKYKNNRFLVPINDESLENYEEKFRDNKENLIIFGHSHKMDQKGKFYCLGSSGCTFDNETFYTELIVGNELKIKRIYLNYDRESFLNSLKTKNYPLKEKLSKSFFGI